jgi:hypothetical protein
MNEKELRRTSDSLAVLVRIEKLSAQVRMDERRRLAGYRPYLR